MSNRVAVGINRAWMDRIRLGVALGFVLAVQVEQSNLPSEKVLNVAMSVPVLVGISFTMNPFTLTAAFDDPT